RTAYAHYCWEVQGLQGIKIAPFHLLATEGKTYFDQDHLWHMQALARLAEQSDLLMATDYLLVNTGDEESVAAGTRWWEEMTAIGGEGMVVKPREFIVRGPKGLVQPAVKVRGREYLRIIYGPEYTAPENIERLRKRGLGAKRSLALREFALGVEGLERFVRKEPLRRVHECAFAVLALESEPVDPRL
ncbi:MAG: putative phosphatase, partial [Chthonomonadales bacterium]|nr:putative phosphatase [Chthonomonadales bacterium]